jgi:hypothetical protein
MAKKRTKRSAKPYEIFDPEDYANRMQGLLIESRLPEASNSYLLEKLTWLDPQGTLVKRLKPKDLDGLSMEDRHALVWQVMEQTALEVHARHGEIDLLINEGFISVELLDWDTYAQRTRGSKAIGPLKDLSATDVLLDLKLLGLIEMVMGTIARRIKPQTLPEETSPTADRIYDEIKRFLTVELVSEIPRAEKNLKKTDRNGEPSATTMMLILRVAMRLFMVINDPCKDPTVRMMGHSIPMFMILYNNNTMYSLWKSIIRGEPFTRFVDNYVGGIYFERIERPQ